MSDAHPPLSCGHRKPHYALGKCQNCWKNDRRANPAATVHTHGYGGYTQGCRCRVCKDAKADYMAGRRAAAYLSTDTVVQGIRHGTQFAYEERGCRCETCTLAEVQRGRVRAS